MKEVHYTKYRALKPGLEFKRKLGYVTAVGLVLLAVFVSACQAPASSSESAPPLNYTPVSLDQFQQFSCPPVPGLGDPKPVTSHANFPEDQADYGIAPAKIELHAKTVTANNQQTFQLSITPFLGSPTTIEPVSPQEAELINARTRVEVKVDRTPQTESYLTFTFFAHCQ